VQEAESAAEQDAESAAVDETAGLQGVPPAEADGFTYYRWEDVDALASGSRATEGPAPARPPSAR
jgi:hypothetical protein